MDFRRVQRAAPVPKAPSSFYGRRRSLRRLFLVLGLASVGWFFAGAIHNVYRNTVDLLFSSGLPDYELRLSRYYQTHREEPSQTRAHRATKASNAQPTSGLGLVDPLLRKDFEDDESNSPRLESHFYRDDGFLEVNPNGRHPIYELMEIAEKRWKEKNDRQSKTLFQAVKEYRRRHKRNPPKGFDHWWHYVQKHKVPLPDEYDRIQEDLEPFWGVRPSDLRAIVSEWSNTPDTWTIGKHKEEDGLSILKESFASDRSDAVKKELLMGAHQLQDILKEVERSIPPFEAVFLPHDNPSLLTDWELRESAIAAAKRGEYIDLSQVPPSKMGGWISACSPLSKAWQSTIDFLTQEPPISVLRHHIPNDTKTFIHDHHKTMDPCNHPDLLRSHGQFLAHLNPGPVPHQRLIPQFTWSPSVLHSDIRPAVSLNWVSEVEDQELDWDRKTDERLYWRGGTTGVYADDNFDLGDGRRMPMRWRYAQRSRMARLGSAVEPLMFEDGALAYMWGLPQKGVPVPGGVYEMDWDSYWVLNATGGREERVGEAGRFSRSSLVASTTDIHFAGKPVSCEEKTCNLFTKIFDFARQAESKEAGRYKYILDVDGNGWSSRFKRLITSNVVVFKSTIYPEWFIDRIQPWLHYVPIQNDFSDLFDSLIFFRGDEGKRGSHDDLARKIAKSGREWSLSHWRKEDLCAYNFRLFLEYARLLSDDRKNMDFFLDDGQVRRPAIFD